MIYASKFFFGQVADFGLAAECKTDLQGVVGTSGSSVLFRMSVQQCGALVCAAVELCLVHYGSPMRNKPQVGTLPYMAPQVRQSSGLPLFSISC